MDDKPLFITLFTQQHNFCCHRTARRHRAKKKRKPWFLLRLWRLIRQKVNR
tara:strand:- start:198 stop:350 length:153 start_codon:yes stop_codon:yes gene_type:complete